MSGTPFQFVYQQLNISISSSVDCSQSNFKSHFNIFYPQKF